MFLTEAIVTLDARIFSIRSTGMRSPFSVFTLYCLPNAVRFESSVDLRFVLLFRKIWCPSLQCMIVKLIDQRALSLSSVFHISSFYITMCHPIYAQKRLRTAQNRLRTSQNEFRTDQNKLRTVQNRFRTTQNSAEQPPNRFRTGSEQSQNSSERVQNSSEQRRTGSEQTQNRHRTGSEQLRTSSEQLRTSSEQV